MLYLHGLGHFHPETVLDNHFLASLDIGVDVAWIEDRVGIVERRTTLPLEYLSRTRNQDPRAASEAANTTPVQMSVAATTLALQRAGLEASQIGMVVSGGCSPEMQIPADSSRAANALGLSEQVPAKADFLTDGPIRTVSDPKASFCSTSGSYCDAGVYDVVTLTAFPNTGYSLLGWSGGTCTGVTNPCVIDPGADIALNGNETDNAAFALTVMWFYFSDIMGKLDRALGLIVLGVLFLAGGWVLEKARRRLVARILEAQA